MRNDIDAWMKAAVRYPLLTPAQEIQLGQRVQRWVTDPAPTRQVVRSGEKAKDRLICCNLRLVAAFALKNSNRIVKSNAIEMEDLLQDGTVGLDTAAKKFDPTAGYKFSTYAYWWIRQAVTKTIVCNQSAIKIPPQANTIRSQWARRTPGQSLEDFSREIGRKPDSVQTYLELCDRATVISSDIPCGSLDIDESAFLLDAIPDPFSDPSLGIDRRHLQDLIDDVRELSPKVVEVFERRELYGVTKMQAIKDADINNSQLYFSVQKLRTDLEGLLGLEIKEALAA